jgi:putative cell wall-binding protein
MLRALSKGLVGVAVILTLLSAPIASTAQATTPSARDDFFSVVPNGKLHVDPPGLLVNDSGDLAGDMAIFDLTSHGDLRWGGTWGKGEFEYEPAPGFTGFDTFQYCLGDKVAMTCATNTATVIIQVGAPVVTRVAGADRYDVAAQVAQKTNPVRSGFVFVTSGEAFADALSVAPAAKKFGVALLLVSRSGVPDTTRREIERLHPAEIIVIGGAASVPESVLSELAGLMPAGGTVSRIGGADRYELSRAIAARLFGESSHSYTATGANFPDALAAAAVAGARSEPVVLLDGGSSSADAATQATFLNLSTSRVTIVGGPASVSSGVEATLTGIARVFRIGGADRYEAAVNLARSDISEASIAYLATGSNFPDALVGGVWAGQTGSPVYLAHQDCVPTSVLADLARIGASEIRLLGGTNSLSERVARLEHC